MLKANTFSKNANQFFYFNVLQPVLIMVLFLGIIQCAYPGSSDVIKKTYCPSKIICLRNDDLSSCFHTSEDSPYLDRITYTSYPHRIFAGQYTFHVADAPYHASYVSASDATQDNMVVCHYINEQAKEPLGILTKSETNLEAYKSIGSKWSLGQVERARCFSASAKDCPLREAHSLAIFNNFDSLVYVSINNSYIPVTFYPDISGYYTVRYDDIVPYCFSENLCKLDLFTLSDGIIGSVIVDIDDAMHVKEIINSEEYSASITQNSPFNSIKVEKSPKQKPFITINNQLNSNLLIAVNGKINLRVNSREILTIRSTLISSACNGYRKCTINIGINSELPNVGTITVDMQDNMRILETSSARASQIIITKFEESNSIEITYPYLNNKKMR